MIWSSKLTVKKYGNNSWTNISSSRVNLDQSTNTKLHDNTGGGSVGIIYKGVPRVFWETGGPNFENTKGVLSSYINNKWEHILINDFQYTPRLTINNDKLYLYFAKPTPTVNQYDGSNLSRFPLLPGAPSSTWTSLAFWRGNPVVSFSTDVRGADNSLTDY